MNRLERIKEIIKATPDFGKRVGYKMCVVDELHDTKEQLKNRAKEFVSKIASGTPQEMDYYANFLVQFANETTKDLEKENTELNDKLNNLAKVAEVRLANWQKYADAYNETQELLDKQIEATYKVVEKLNKVKELLREFVNWANWQGNSKCPSFKSIQDRAEQFLEEE